MTIMIGLEIIVGSRMVEGWFGMLLYVERILAFSVSEFGEGVSRLVIFKFWM